MRILFLVSLYILSLENKNARVWGYHLVLDSLKG